MAMIEVPERVLEQERIHRHQLRRLNKLIDRECDVVTKEKKYSPILNRLIAMRKGVRLRMSYNAEFYLK